VIPVIGMLSRYRARRSVTRGAGTFSAVASIRDSAVAARDDLLERRRAGSYGFAAVSIPGRSRSISLLINRSSTSTSLSAESAFQGVLFGEATR
jgi:hypothetical protein